MQFRLDGLRMHAVQTAKTGVINKDTIFEFTQVGDRVWADYSGGKVERGYLVGVVSGNKLNFRYCQMSIDGDLEGGESNCDLEVKDGLVRIIEHFNWESRPGGGTNVIQELILHPPSSTP